MSKKEFPFFITFSGVPFLQEKYSSISLFLKCIRKKSNYLLTYPKDLDPSGLCLGLHKTNLPFHLPKLRKKKKKTTPQLNKYRTRPTFPIVSKIWISRKKSIGSYVNHVLNSLFISLQHLSLTLQARIILYICEGQRWKAGIWQKHTTNRIIFSTYSFPDWLPEPPDQNISI